MNNRIDNSAFGIRPARATGMTARPCAAPGLPGRVAQSKIGNRKLAIAFTLVEMLVAILILVVGVALCVGVGSMVREGSQSEETRNIQAVLRSALHVYHGNESAWPAGDGTPESTTGLINALRKDQSARAELAKLPQQAILVDDTGGEFVMDGFGNRMLYHQTGGLAGGPLLISPGKNPRDPADDINADVN